MRTRHSRIRPPGGTRRADDCDDALAPRAGRLGCAGRADGWAASPAPEARLLGSACRAGDFRGGAMSAGRARVHRPGSGCHAGSCGGGAVVARCPRTPGIIAVGLVRDVVTGRDGEGARVAVIGVAAPVIGWPGGGRRAGDCVGGAMITWVLESVGLVAQVALVIVVGAR